MVLFIVFLTDSKNNSGRGRALLTQLVVGVTLKMPTGCGNGGRLQEAVLSLSETNQAINYSSAASCSGGNWSTALVLEGNGGERVCFCDYHFPFW